MILNMYQKLAQNQKYRSDQSVTNRIGSREEMSNAGPMTGHTGPESSRTNLIANISRRRSVLTKHIRDHTGQKQINGRLFAGHRSEHKSRQSKRTLTHSSTPKRVLIRSRGSGKIFVHTSHLTCYLSFSPKFGKIGLSNLLFSVPKLLRFGVTNFPFR